MNLARSRPKPASGKTSRAVAARLSQTRLGEVQGRKRSDTGRSPGAAPEQGRAAGAEIEMLEAAHPELKVKGREANRTVKAANRRIAELEARVNLLQTKSARKPDPAGPLVAEANTARRGRPPGRSKTIDSARQCPRRGRPKLRTAGRGSSGPERAPVRRIARLTSDVGDADLPTFRRHDRPSLRRPTAIRPRLLRRPSDRLQHD